MDNKRISNSEILGILCDSCNLQRSFTKNKASEACIGNLVRRLLSTTDKPFEKEDIVALVNNKVQIHPGESVKNLGVNCPGWDSNGYLYFYTRDNNNSDSTTHFYITEDDNSLLINTRRNRVLGNGQYETIFSFNKFNKHGLETHRKRITNRFSLEHPVSAFNEALRILEAEKRDSYPITLEAIDRCPTMTEGYYSKTEIDLNQNRPFQSIPEFANANPVSTFYRAIEDYKDPETDFFGIVGLASRRKDTKVPRGLVPLDRNKSRYLIKADEQSTIEQFLNSDKSGALENTILDSPSEYPDLYRAILRERSI